MAEAEYRFFRDGSVAARVTDTAEWFPLREAGGVALQAHGRSQARAFCRHPSNQPLARRIVVPQAPEPATSPALKPRRCLCCRQAFTPESRFDFICSPCEGKPRFRAGAIAEDVAVRLR